jgi:hypothetical protein
MILVQRNVDDVALVDIMKDCRKERP